MEFFFFFSKWNYDFLFLVEMQCKMKLKNKKCIQPQISHTTHNFFFKMQDNTQNKHTKIK